MLASARARHTYEKLRAQNIAATVCRGTTVDDFNFFYSILEYWSDHCLGWVADTPNRPRVCPYCRLVSAPKHEFDPIIDNNDAGKKHRNGNSSHRQPVKPDSARSPELPEVRAVSKHSSAGTKGDADAKTKAKKVKKLQKVKNKGGKPKSKPKSGAKSKK